MIRRDDQNDISGSAVRWARRGSWAMLLVGLSGGAAIAMAAQNAPQLAATSSLFAQHATQAKLRTCMTTYPALGAMVAEGSTYNVASAWNASAPDAHPVRGLVGLTLQSPQYQGPAAGVVFAVPEAQGCAGGAVRVVPFPQACADIAKQLPAGSRLVRELSGTPLYEVGNRSGQIMLLNNPGGCVAISVNQIG